MDSLWQEYWEHRSENVRNKLIERNQNLVWFHVGRLKVPVSPEELFSAGCDGLMDAVERWDPVKAAFSTFAAQRIQGAMLDWLRDFDHQSRLVRKWEWELQRTTFYEREGRVPTDGELASEMSISQDRLREFQGASKAGSLVEISSGEDTIWDLKGKAVDPSHRLSQREDFDILISRFTKRERLVLTLRYVEKLEFYEIGQVIGVVESRVCQMHTNMMKELRAA